MSAPIRNALPIVRTALYAALSPLVSSYAGLPASYWRRATDALGLVGALTANPPTLAGAIVAQSQDAGGQGVIYLDDADWQGLITIRCLAGSLAAAEALLQTIPEPLLLTAPTGYALRADFVRPLDLPQADGVHTAAAIYRVTVSRI